MCTTTLHVVAGTDLSWRGDRLSSVNLSIAECRIRLNASDHGILSTAHPERLIDSVPVCFVVSSEMLVIPIDQVKPKRHSALQRSKNLALEPRATLLCERWEMGDWTQLWWVRVNLCQISRETLDTNVVQRGDQQLREKYSQYQTTEFADLLLFSIDGIYGWSAST